MKRFLVLTTSALVAVACHRSGSLQRQQQQYEVVQEGEAGASSTINAPGETTPPATTSAMNGTSVDTTTNFTLPNGAAAPGTTTGNPASTMTAPAGNVAIPMPPRPVPTITVLNTPAAAPTPRPRAPETATTAPPPPTETAEGPPTDTSSNQPPPTQTDTSGKPPSSE